MDAPVTHGADRSIGELFGRVTDEGKAFVQAEIGLYKAIAARRAAKAGSGAAALVAALFLLNAALITLIVCLALELAMHVGPAFAGLIVFAVVGIGCFFLVRFGLAKMKALSGDEEEKAALALGETTA